MAYLFTVERVHGGLDERLLGGSVHLDARDDERPGVLERARGVQRGEDGQLDGFGGKGGGCHDGQEGEKAVMRVVSVAGAGRGRRRGR